MSPLSLFAGQAVVVPPPPTGDLTTLTQPISGAATLVFSWGSTTVNPTFTGTAPESIRITGAVV